MRSKILLVVGYYLPSFHGGISKTIQNLLSETADKFDYEIITRDRDKKKDPPYNSIKSNKWNNVKNVYIYYANENTFSFKKILEIISQKKYNIIHLNSLFDLFSIKFLILFRFKKIKNCRIILSPRGEFGEASFRIRKLKKIIYLYIMKKFGFFNNLFWHASTKLEQNEIKYFFKDENIKCLIANDISTNVKISNYISEKKKNIKKNIVFLSSISPEKNLLYALDIMKNVKTEIEFDIWGPIKDKKYWNQCKKIMKTLPKNIELKYLGFLEEKDVLSVLSRYDLMFLPTGGENFGHVISEALSVGTKVLISNKTQWQNLEQNNLGWDFDLKQSKKFINILENEDKIMLSNNKKVRIKVIENFNSYYPKLDIINDNIKLYNGIL